MKLHKGGAYAINSFEVFLIVTALVAYISGYGRKTMILTTSKGYFLAGRGLSGIVIGCSMVLTSLSTGAIDWREMPFLIKTTFLLLRGLCQR